jgi:antirestriction protein ArdC
VPDDNLTNDRMTNPMTKANDTLNNIALQVIDLMKENGTQWTKPWKNAVAEYGEPRSAKNRAYTGINRLNLGLVMACAGYSSPIFGTFKQWKSLGANVKKGSKGIGVIFYSKAMVKDKETGETKAIPLIKTFTVFNADQVENWTGAFLPVEAPSIQDWDNILTADQLLNDTSANINYGNQNKAFYSPAHDLISLPKREQFKDASGFYGTALHELIHWTGHESRLDRKFATRFGNDQYAFEELIAELGAAMLSNITKVDAEPRADHAVYLNSWIQCLSDNPKAILKAASMAEKASQFVIDTTSNIKMRAA